MSVPSRALACSIVSTKSPVAVGDYTPPDVRVKTSAKRVRCILETTRQDRCSLVKLCFLFIRVHVIKSDGLTNVPQSALWLVSRHRRLTASHDETNR
jgi:hypothetical protein